MFLQAGIWLHLVCTGPEIELDLHDPRTASSGRKLMLTNAGGSYGLRLSFSGSLFTGSSILLSAFGLHYFNIGIAARRGRLRQLL